MLVGPQGKHLLYRKSNINQFPSTGIQTSKISQRIAEKFGLVNISAGQILRQEVEQKSSFGNIIADYLDRGEFGKTLF